MALRLPIGEDNWSLKIADGWPEDPEEDVAAGGMGRGGPDYGRYGEPRRAPDCDPGVPLPASVRAMTGG